MGLGQAGWGLEDPANQPGAMMQYDWKKKRTPIVSLQAAI